jgi:SAM-dependent methyltransferase
MASDTLIPKNSYVPKNSYDRDRLSDPNVFRTVFGAMPDSIWRYLLKASVGERVIEGVEFPSFPEAELQSLIQGSSGEQAMDEAFNFYAFVKRHLGPFPAGARFLDYGSGWGRILRPFLRDFDLADIYGYEPSPMFRTISRTLNPYVCILPGEYMPNGRIPPGFDLIVGYSVFSHLSPVSAEAWLAEFARVMNPGGHGVFTTWGVRFLTYLAGEKAKLERGETIHWFHQHVLSNIADLDGVIRRVGAGEFFWQDMEQGPLYGEAYLPRPALEAMIARLGLPLDVVLFDTESLPQDVFVIRRR